MANRGAFYFQIITMERLLFSRNERENKIKPIFIPLIGLSCKDCNATYIGETKRSFEVRYKEHNRAVRNGDTDKNEIAEGLTMSIHV